MTEYRVIDRRTNVETILSQLTGQIGEAKTEYLRRMVDVVVRASPVDTGTYMENHDLNVTRTGGKGTESSHGKERGQSRNQFASAAVEKLNTQIDAAPKDWEQLFFRNNSVHAPLVEYGGAKMPVIYAPYQTARSLAKRIAEQVVEELKNGR